MSLATSLDISRIVAKARYKVIEEPSGDPGSDTYAQAHRAACTEMRTALDAFRAPSGGDAQWLYRIYRSYSDANSSFAFTCKEIDRRSCGAARHSLTGLALHMAQTVETIECSKAKTGNSIDLCYRLRFPYPTERVLPDTDDDPLVAIEWIVTVAAGMRDGSAPVEIRSLHLEHVPRLFGIP